MRTTRDQYNRLKLLSTAVGYLGTDASPKDEADDELGCADSVSKVILTAFPGAIRGSVSTAELYNQLLASPSFRKVTEIRPGDVLISPTGKGKTGKVKHGHTGIVGENDEIMSNSSSTGLWTANFTMKSWIARYRTLGGYPMYFFRKV